MTKTEVYCKGVISRRLNVILLIGVAIILCSMGISKVELLSDYTAFFDDKYQPKIELDEIEETFTENKNVLIALAPANGNVFSKETIEALRRLTQQAWLTPYADRVDSLTNYQHIESQGDDILVEDLVPASGQITDAMVSRARSVGMSERGLKGRLVGKQGDVSAVNINFQYPDNVVLADARKEVFSHLNTTIARLSRDYPKIKIYATGTEVLDHSIASYSEADAALIIPCALLLMFLVLIILLKTLIGAVLSLFLIIVTTTSTMGVVGWLGIELDAVTALSPIIILTLALADSVHLIMGVKNQSGKYVSAKTAVAKGLAENLSPITLTSMTTILGMATLGFAELYALRKLGLVISIGVAFAWLYSITILPALLSYWRFKPYTRDLCKEATGYLVKAVSSNGKSVLAVTACLVVFLLALSTNNEINESVDNFYDGAAPEREAISFVSNNLSGSFVADIAIFTDVEGGIAEPEFLNKVDKFERWLETNQAAAHINSITDVFRRINRSMNGGRIESLQLPDNKALAAQYLLLYEMSLPYGLGTNHLISQDQSAVRVLLTLKTATGKEVVDLKRSVNAWFNLHAPEYRVVVTGVNPVMGELAYLHLIPGMLKGGVIALLMVGVALMVVLRNVWLGVAGVLATLLPILMAYGVWGGAVGLINFSVMSVAGICLGIVVDFSVHILVKFKREYNQGRSVFESIGVAYAITGRSLFATMATLVIGFSLLSLSHITLNAYMGTLTGLTIFIGYLFDVLVLPALLVFFLTKYQDERTNNKGNFLNSSISR